MYIHNRSQRRKVTNRYKRKRMYMTNSLGDDYPYDVIKERRSTAFSGGLTVYEPCLPYLKYYGFSKKLYKRKSNKVWRSSMKRKLSYADEEDVYSDNPKRLYDMFKEVG